MKLDYILDLEEHEIVEEYEYASAWKRLANYIIDKIIIQVLYYLSIICLQFIPGLMRETNWIIIPFYFGIHGAYYILLEYLNGKTIGKYITDTSVLHESGKNPSLKNIIIRSLCRHIPFEGFSYIGGTAGWHDLVSKTTVVVKKY
jgi:uncharacterized RDD family membrane protein YckC